MQCNFTHHFFQHDFLVNIYFIAYDRIVTGDNYKKYNKLVVTFVENKLQIWLERV